MKVIALSILAAVAVVGCSTTQTSLAHIDGERVKEIANHIIRTDERVSIPYENLKLNNIQADFSPLTGSPLITVIFEDTSSLKVLTRDAQGKPKQQSVRLVRIFINDNGETAGVHECIDIFEEPEWKN